MRKIFVIATVVFSLFFSVPVYASGYSDILGELMYLIEEEYVGEEVSEEELYEAAMIGMSYMLDNYSGYMNEEVYTDFNNEFTRRPVGIGIAMRRTDMGAVEITRVMKDSPAERAGFARGDFLISINGVPVSGMSLNEVSGLITADETKPAIIEFSRTGVKRTVSVKCEELKSHTVYTDDISSMTKKTADGIGYINLSSFVKSTAVDLEAAIDQLKTEGKTKLILDLRYNMGGILGTTEDICNMLVPEGNAYSVLNNHGETVTKTTDLKTLPFNSTVVLVDQDTASSAELLAAAMQDSDMFVVGQTTYGKGVVQSIYNLPTGGAFKLTTEEYFRRSGEKVNGIGVIPDFIVATDMSDYNTPDDLMLLKAVELLS